MATIYLVQGSTGEYDSYSEWIVKAYRNEQRAKDHAEKAEARAEEIRPHRHTEDWWVPGPSINPKYINEFDPEMWMDYTGASYTVCSVELVEED